MANSHDLYLIQLKVLGQRLIENYVAVMTNVYVTIAFAFASVRDE